MTESMTEAKTVGGTPKKQLPLEFQHMVAHHSELTTRLSDYVAALRSAVEARRAFAEPHATVRDFLAAEVIPHALAEEDTVYAVASGLPSLPTLVEGMMMEHQVLLDLAARQAEADDGLSSLSLATAFVALFDVHVRKENELLLPTLVSEGTDAGGLLAAMQSAFGRRRAAAAAPADAGGVTDADGVTDVGESEVVVDTRAPDVDSCVSVTNQAIDALPSGKSFRLIADHDPIGLHYMLDAERPGATTWQLLEDGPERWQVRISKVAQAS